MVTAAIGTASRVASIRTVIFATDINQIEVAAIALDPPYSKRGCLKVGASQSLFQGSRSACFFAEVLSRAIL